MEAFERLTLIILSHPYCYGVVEKSFSDIYIYIYIYIYKERERAIWCRLKLG